MALKKQFAQQYANTHVETSVSEATPHRLTEMLYEGVIKHLGVAKVFIEQKNFEKKAEHLNKTLTIIMSLRENVDLDRGGDVAQNLYALYDYCYRQLVKASVKNDLVIVDEVLGHIKGLNDAWSQMPDSYKNLSQEQLKTMNA